MSFIRSLKIQKSRKIFDLKSTNKSPDSFGGAGASAGFAVGATGTTAGQ